MLSEYFSNALARPLRLTATPSRLEKYPDTMTNGPKRWTRSLVDVELAPPSVLGS